MSHLKSWKLTGWLWTSHSVSCQLSSHCFYGKIRRRVCWICSLPWVIKVGYKQTNMDAIRIYIWSFPLRYVQLDLNLLKSIFNIESNRTLILSWLSFSSLVLQTITEFMPWISTSLASSDLNKKLSFISNSQIICPNSFIHKKYEMFWKTIQMLNWNLLLNPWKIPSKYCKYYPSLQIIPICRSV